MSELQETTKKKIFYVITKSNWGGAIESLRFYYKNPRFLLFSSTGKLHFPDPLPRTTPLFKKIYG